MMRTGRPFRWVEAARGRHAIPEHAQPEPGEEITAICGAAVVLTNVCPRRAFPECADCDRVWRQTEGIPLRAGS